MTQSTAAEKRLDKAVAARLKKPLTGFEKKVLRLIFTSALGAANRQTFCEDLAKFVEKGIKPFDAVTDIHRVACDNRSMEWQRNLCTLLILDMKKKGTDFSVALARWLPSDEGLMLISGERSDLLVETLKRLSGLQAQRREILGVMWETALPVVLIFATLMGMIYYMAGSMQGQIVELLGQDLIDKEPTISAYMTMCNFVVEWWAVLLLALFGFASTVILSIPRWKPGAVRSWMDKHVFPWNMFARTKGCYMLISAALSLKAGRTYREFVEGSIGQSKGWELWHYRRIMRRLKDGLPEVESMRGGMVPREIENRLSIYSRLGDFDSIMEAVATDSLDGLLKSIRAVGIILQNAAKIALIAFVLATLATVGFAALEFQTSIQNQGQGAIK